MNNFYEIPNPITLYSPYGYIDVDINELKSNVNLLKFHKNINCLYGRINVIIYN
jgi:hypothetical protein